MPRPSKGPRRRDGKPLVACQHPAVSAGLLSGTLTLWPGETATGPQVAEHPAPDGRHGWCKETQCEARTMSISVPEPATVILLGVGLLVLSLLAWRRSRRK